MASRSLDPKAAERLRACARAADAAAFRTALDELHVPPGARIKGRPLLQLALGFDGGEATATVLFERGARIDARDDGGWTALHHAAFSGRDAVIRFLLARGADPRLTERGVGWNALHCLMSGAVREFGPHDAAWWDALVVALIAGGADPFAPEHPPSRRLTREIEREIGKGIDVLPAEDPATPFSLAARLADPVPLRCLLAAAPRRPSAAEATTAFRAAVAAGQVEHVRLLATLGADATIPGADGETPVSLAVERKDASLLRAVLQAGGDPTAPQGKREQAPIVRAAHLGATELLDVLIAAGADVHARDRWGHSALSISLEAGREDAVARLTAAGASEPPSLGVLLGEPVEGVDGIPVRNVLRGSTADALGLMKGDRIVAVDGRPVAAIPELHAAIAVRKTGDVIEICWGRGCDVRAATAPLGHRRPVILPDDPVMGLKFPR